MAVPSPRNSVRIARGAIADLQAELASIGEGEICYAKDENRVYVKEDGILTAASASLAQGVLADTSIQPGDNNSELTNDSGYITLSDIAVTTNKFVYVSKEGDDLTGELDNPGKPFLTVKAAVEAVALAGQTGYLVDVAPGTYSEANPITLPNGCLVVSSHTSVSSIQGSVVIQPLSNSNHLFEMSPNSQVDGLSLVTPSGASFAAVYYDGPSNTLASVTNIKITGNSAGGLGTGILMNASSGNGKIVAYEIRYGGGTLRNLCQCSGGILAIESVHVPATGNVDDSIEAVFDTDLSSGNTLSRLQAIDSNSGSPDVEYFYHNTGGTAVFFSTNYFNGSRGLLLDSNSYNVAFYGGLLDTTNEIIVTDPSVTGTDGKLYINAKMNENFVIGNSVWWNSDYVFEFATDADDTNTYGSSRQVWGADVVIGHSRQGSGLFVGQGSAFSNPVTERVFATSNNTLTTEGSGLVDLTSVALDKEEASTYTFNAIAANEAIYFATIRRDSSNNLIKHYGLRTGHLEGDSRDGEYMFERWTGAGWEKINIQAVNRDTGFNYCTDVMWRGGDSHEYILYGLDETSTWSLKTINGINAYWSRIRIVTPPTVLPILYHMQGLPESGFEITQTGKQVFYGKSQFRRALQAASGECTYSGGTLTGSQQVGTGSNQYSHQLASARFDGPGDRLYWNMRMPEGVCTAFPLYVDVAYSIASGFDAVTPAQLGFTFHAIPVAGMYVADPNGGIAPVPRDPLNTDPTTTGNPQRQTVEVDGDSQDIIYNITFGPFYANESYEGDMITMSLDYIDDGSSNADIDFWNIALRTFRWTEGERQA